MNDKEAFGGMRTREPASRMDGRERPVAPAGLASGLWTQGPGRARRLASPAAAAGPRRTGRAVAAWPRMACAALLSCAAAGPATGAPVSWKGPGSVSIDGTALVAVPYAPGAFERWEGAPCDGAAGPVCELPGADAPAAMPTAVFRPFVVAGVKSLAFGLGYQKVAGSHFRVCSRDAPGAGLSPVPGLGRLPPGAEPALLEASVHLLPWGLGGYVTEVCDAGGCAAAPGGERTLAQADSTAAIGRLKAPNADAGDRFGAAIALSADGSTLAVGAPHEDSSAAGAFAPSDAGYQAVLDSDGDGGSGAVYVHRRSAAGRWALEAFVKAPVAGAGDGFGHALALSADGAALAVGAPHEDSSATGAFAPGGDGYQAALDSDGAYSSGATYVHRRSAAGRWVLKAFVKAPVADAGDGFGHALALSADGSTLAVGAPHEDSSAAGACAPTDAGYRTALDSGGGERSGAAYVHRRSAAGRWALEAFVKAPLSGIGDNFGSALALSADGSTLAVGAPDEGSAAAGAFAPSDAGHQAALESDGAIASGAAYVHRRSAGGRWALEAFVKAPAAGAGDAFGSALALSADGSALAVGAPHEGHLDVPREYRDRRSGRGAAYVHRRSAAGLWAFEAVVKAPGAERFDMRRGGRLRGGLRSVIKTHFDILGSALALSADGSALVMGAVGEGSAATGAFAPGGTGYQAALDDGGAEDSGAAYVHRRSAAGDWTAGHFLKALNPGIGDHFGTALALSADGSALAVGAPEEGGSARSRPVGGGSADAGNAAYHSGAVYLY